MDKPTADLATAITDDVLRDAIRWTEREYQPLIDAAVCGAGSGFGLQVAEVASHTLKRCIEAVTAKLRAYAMGYSGLRWLWMLRRLPDEIFHGVYRTTMGYDRTLAEALAGSAKGRGRSRIHQLDRGARAYPLDATVVKRLVRYAVAVRLLSTLHSEYRWAGKGLGFEFERNRVPRRTTDVGLQASVSLYDSRVARSGDLGRMGTEVFTPARAVVELRDVLATLDEAPETMFFRLVSLSPARDLEVPAPDGAPLSVDHPTAVVRARHMLIPVPMASLAGLLEGASADKPILDASSAALLFLLWGGLVYVTEHRAGLLGLATTGYLLSDERFLRARIEESFSHAPELIKEILASAGVRSAHAAIDLVEKMTGNPWPLAAGPIIYRDDDQVALDFAAASRRLTDSVIFPRVNDERAKVRSAHFELRAQDAVDRSSHAPPASVHALRGRTLRVDGQSVTDLDAIACLGTTLLLISCKSVLYSPEYDVGEHRAVRNAASTVRGARDDWERIVDRLRKHPVGDNYDLSGRELLGVVCTPTVVWVEEGPCTEYVTKGLRAVVSLSELQEWLKGGDT